MLCYGGGGKLKSFSSYYQSLNLDFFYVTFLLTLVCNVYIFSFNFNQVYSVNIKRDILFWNVEDTPAQRLYKKGCQVISWCVKNNVSVLIPLYK